MRPVPAPSALASEADAAAADPAADDRAADDARALEHAAAHPWVALGQSALGALLLFAHSALGGALALELPTWPTLVYVYLIVGPHVARFERVVGALERLLERLERLIRAAAGTLRRRTP